MSDELLQAILAMNTYDQGPDDYVGIANFGPQVSP